MKTVSPNDRRVNRWQNLSIFLLALSAVFLFANLPLFGVLSDRSLLELARDRIRRENIVAQTERSSASLLALPVRMVYTNDFARLGADALTTLSDEFEHAGTYLGEALGSAYDTEPISEQDFLAALRDEGLYFDFTTSFPSDVLSELLGVSLTEDGLASVRRMLLSPAGEGDAVLYAQDGAGQSYRFSTAVSSPALVDFLAARSGNSADFAFMLGAAYEQLSPYTLVLSDPPPRGTLSATNVLSGSEDAFLRHAEFNAHTENRFTESSGTVIVREVSNALYLRPDGTVDYQGSAAAPDSLYFVSAADPGAPTLAEAAAAAQNLASTLLQDVLGDAVLCLSGASAEGERCEISFDLMANGTPIRFSDGSHAVTVTTEGQVVTAFTLKARGYTLTEDTALLLPFAQAAAIARAWEGAELFVAYVDTGAESVLPAWIAE